jgi:glycine cleavage system aminomethyltransferase T
MSNEPTALPLVPTIPVPEGVRTFTQFGESFEPWEYTDWLQESMSWKESCYIGNWSGLQKHLITGPDAIRLFSDLVGNNFDRFPVGMAKHISACTPGGLLLGDGILMRRAEDQVLSSLGRNAVVWVEHMLAEGDYDIRSEIITHDEYVFQVQGPKSLHLLEEATGESFREIEFMHFAERSIEGNSFTALRQGMAGEVGFELQGPAATGKEVWSRIFEIGEAYGIKRLGARTKMINHVEACFPTPSVDYMPAWFDPSIKELGEKWAAEMPAVARFFFTHRGSQVTDDVSDFFYSPVDMGWERTLKFDHDFVGREALEEKVANPTRRIVTLVWNAEDVMDVHGSLYREGDSYQLMELPRGQLGTVWGDRVLRDGEQVGITTSRCYSYFFRQMISLCPIAISCSEPGTEVEVLWGEPGYKQKTIRATVAPAPYTTDRRREDLASVAAR